MSGRPMKFPYTLAAKIARFPFEHFYVKTKYGWLLKYWTIATVCCLPIFYSIQKLSYNPNNVKKWEEIRKHQFSSEMRH